MTTKQLKWIYKKAIYLIDACEGKELSEDDARKISDYVDKVNEDSKGNAYCRDVMVDVLSAIDREQGKFKD